MQAPLERVSGRTARWASRKLLSLDVGHGYTGRALKAFLSLSLSIIIVVVIVESQSPTIYYCAATVNKTKTKHAQLEAIVSEDEDAGASSRNSNAIDVNAVLELRDKMSLDDAKLTLANLIRDGWLAKRGQKITLGVRTLLDLRGYLEDVYGVDVLSNVSRYS
eukprot:GEZU01005570.1.p1 GENE.GEZU01005570.1~~GEZU01005570.1.p1  ORF type:complete len:163 (+),score=13.43 GEZU01005570.1:44-532(+)